MAIHACDAFEKAYIHGGPLSRGALKEQKEEKQDSERKLKRNMTTAHQASDYPYEQTLVTVCVVHCACRL
jgi:hypothetical protein